MRGEWTNIENAVDRTEAAVIEEATPIAQIRRQIALIIEALEKLDLRKPRDWEIIREKPRHATDIPKFFNN